MSVTEFSMVKSWAAIAGRWTFDGASATYGETDPAGASAGGTGIAVSDLKLRAGSIRAELVLDRPDSSARILFGHDIASGRQYYAGIGGRPAAYAIEHLTLPDRVVALERRGRPRT